MRGVFVLWLCLLAIGCSKQVEKPKELIPETKMISVLKEVHIAEAAIQSAKADQKDSIATLYYSTIFKIHDIGEQSFYESLDYYMMQPKRFEQMYEQVVEKINETTANVENKEK